MTFKKLICKIFGHRFGKWWYHTTEYRTMANGIGRGKKSKRLRKKKVVTTWRKCKRCGAYIKVARRNVY